jgi:multiple sugar transport system substrate-binding protein
MRPRRIVAVAVLLGLFAVTGCSGGGKQDKDTAAPGQPANIVLWHGYTDAEAKAINQLAAKFNGSQRNVHVTVQFQGNNDYALQKVLTAVAGGKYPDIAYLYGSNAAELARSRKVVRLTDWVNGGGVDWNDFWPGERAAATVDGQIVGVPALVDNLALVYSKKLFDNAHLSYPTADWTWDDFRKAARTLTDPSRKQFGWAYVADGSEDTVWRYEAMLWQAGGDILTPDNRAPAFGSPAGLAALTLLHEMATVDRSVYLDNGNGNYLGLFDAGKIGMLWTGPWDLADIRDHKVDYGVQILPADQNHQTISGPDNWVVFDNGKARVEGAKQFLTWLTDPKQLLSWSMATGDLPVRASVTKLPEYAQFVSRYPGIGTFTDNLANAQKARPTIPTYAKVSAALGQSVVSVLLGKAQPDAALKDAADQVSSVVGAP